MTEQKTFTLEQMRRAFYEKFTGAGELWYTYFGTQEEQEAAVDFDWEDFVERLTAKTGEHSQ